MHHPAFSINSLCHRFGKQDYDRADESRNLAFHTWGGVAQHLPLLPGLLPARVDGRQIDLSARFIELMEKLGIAYDVVRLGSARRGARVNP